MRPHPWGRGEKRNNSEQPPPPGGRGEAGAGAGAQTGGPCPDSEVREVGRAERTECGAQGGLPPTLRRSVCQQEGLLEAGTTSPGETGPRGRPGAFDR